MSAPNPLIIPDVITGFLRRHLTIEPDVYLNRPAPAWDGLSPIEWVRAGHSWDEVLAAVERGFNYEVTA